MEIIINKEKHEISILSDNKVLLMLYIVPSYFVFDFISFEQIVVSKSDNEIFYSNLEWLMNQSYNFSNKYCYKDENKLVWFSEHCFDLESEFEVNNTPRLVIEHNENIFLIYCKRPYFEENNIKRGSVVSFAPAGNGYLNKNTSTNSTLQDDMVKVFLSTLNNERIEKQYKKVKR